MVNGCGRPGSETLVAATVKVETMYQYYKNPSNDTILINMHKLIILLSILLSLVLIQGKKLIIIFIAYLLTLISITFPIWNIFMANC